MPKVLPFGHAARPPEFALRCGHADCVADFAHRVCLLFLVRHVLHGANSVGWWRVRLPPILGSAPARFITASTALYAPVPGAATGKEIDEDASPRRSAVGVAAD